MAPADIPLCLPFSVALEVCKEDDLRRLACAFLSARTKVDFDHHKAALEYGGPTAKGDSFKRQIWVITKKIKEAAESQCLLEEGGGHGKGRAQTVNGKGGGRKRKAGKQDGEVVKKKGRKGAKKADSDDTIVKAEEDGEEDEGGFLV